MTPSQKRAIETTRQQLSEALEDSETTPELLMRFTVEHMLAQNLAHSPKATERSLRGSWDVPMLLSNGKKTKRSVHKQYQICKQLCEAIRDDGREPWRVIDSAVADGLLSNTRRGYVGMPGVFTKGGKKSEEQPAI